MRVMEINFIEPAYAAFAGGVQARMLNTNEERTNALARGVAGVSSMNKATSKGYRDTTGLLKDLGIYSEQGPASDCLLHTLILDTIRLSTMPQRINTVML
jgi:hypothetical protein